jgi:hypothetical protein
MKRYNEIKAGVITSCVGIGIAIFLYVFMQGIILNGNVSSVEVLSRLWIAGVLPLFVGMALIVNGLFVSKKLVEIDRRASHTAPHNLEGGLNAQSLGPADKIEVIPSGFSVTEDTTKHLRSSGEKQ